jgi:hypothetical protein
LRIHLSPFFGKAFFANEPTSNDFAAILIIIIILRSVYTGQVGGMKTQATATMFVQVTGHPRFFTTTPYHVTI